MPAFGKGFDPVVSARARARLLTSRRYVRVRPRAPLRPARSLSSARLRYLTQGQVGTCWLHAPTQLAETVAGLRGYQRFPICRALIGWAGKQLEGGGNPGEGGSGLDALTVMTAEKGYGIAHENLYPYRDDEAYLGRKPPDLVFTDARATHLAMPIDVSGLDEARTLIDAAHPTPTCIGVWCPNNWMDPSGWLYRDFGAGEYGHEVLIVGYAQAGVLDREEVFQIDNWWDLIYPPLPAELAVKVPGYAPVRADKTSDFWITRGALEGLIAKGDAELSSATDVLGLAGGEIEALSSSGLL